MNCALAAQIQSLETMAIGQLVKKHESVIEEDAEVETSGI